MQPGYLIVLVVSIGFGFAVCSVVNVRIGLEIGRAQGAECAAVCTADGYAAAAVYDDGCECGATPYAARLAHDDRLRELQPD